MRNTLAGKFTGDSESSRYFARNSSARKKKNKYNKEYHATAKRKRYRAALNKVNRNGSSVKGDGKDASHTKDGRVVMESASVNRARNGKNGKSTRK